MVATINGSGSFDIKAALTNEIIGGCLDLRMRTVEVREASAAAVAKAFCEPSEFIVLFAVARPVTYCNK